MQLFFSLPSLEKTGDELCFISHPLCDRRMQCNIFGHLTMDQNWQGWEVWRFVRNHDDGTFVITSWTHHRKVLCSNPEGGVFTTENKEGDWERWRITKHPHSQGLLIQSVAHNRYLAFHGEKLYLADSLYGNEQDGSPTAWFLEPGHRNHFFISAACHDLRVSSSNYKMLFTRKNRESWEKWIVQPTENIGSFTICSVEHNRCFLGSNQDGKLQIQNEPEEWRLVQSRHSDGVYIEQTRENGEVRLSCDESGLLYLSEDDEGWETWRLEAIMPHTISGPQIWSYVGIGISSIGLAVAAPFAVMGVVGAMGFTASGITAGSAAAGMMSAEAIASGGVIAAGGTVATLQSIGAVGLGAAGTLAAVGSGAAVGGAVSAGVAKGLENIIDGHSPPANDALASSQLLPLCSWRQW